MQGADRVIGKREAIYKGSIYKFYFFFSHINVRRAQLTSPYRIFNEPSAFFYPNPPHLPAPSRGATPVSPRRLLRRVCMCALVCVCLTCVSHVKNKKKASTPLPRVALCYISSCCAAKGRVTRSIDPGVNTS